MEVEIIQQLMGSLGFPIFVAVWHMWERQNTMKDLTKAINNNTNALNILTSKVCK